MTYIEELESAIVKLHGAEALYLGSTSVEEVSKGKVIWKGVVEHFELKKHPSAKACYAWGVQKDPTDKSKGLDITTVLEIPPVNSPETAVTSAIAAQTKAKKPSRR